MGYVVVLIFSDGYRDRDRRSPTYYDESEPEESFRIFVALFDYDPLSMSPNPDAADEELPFKEGQIIRVRVSITMVSYLHTFRLLCVRQPLSKYGLKGGWIFSWLSIYWTISYMPSWNVLSSL